MTAAANAETLGFQTEARQLLHLMIHSLYSNREIFLRELISNASDACDKLRFEAMKNADLYENSPSPEIRVSVDESEGTITISDNGIGMNRQDVIDNLGTIARSGTASFMEALSGDQKKDAQLIGQFGVGFYSCFIVADRVEVSTRRAGEPTDQGVKWTCAGEAEYTIESIDKADRGTTIVLYLKEDAKEFANDWRLRSIIKKYSDHIAIPIAMPKAAEDVEGDDDKADQKAVEWESVNDASALWMRPRNEIGDDDYKHFYQHIAHDFSDPLTWAHNKVEGKYEYTSLLYIPSRAPFDLYQRDASRGIKLYVQRTFIMDEAEQFLPLYLRFVKGVVDSNDLPLNVSREILQNSPAVSSIRAALTKRVLDTLEKLAEDKPDDYTAFWAEFGAVLKEGLGEDFVNREKIAGLLRFASTAAGDELVSLKDYVSRMKEKQGKIYYLIAENRKAAGSSPYLEIFRKHGVEVLLLTQRIDEWMMSYLNEFDGKPLQDIAKGEVDLGEIIGEEKPASDEAGDATDKPDHSAVTARLKELLGDTVEDVRVSRRLTDSPACLVVGEDQLGVQMRRILEAAGQSVPDTKPVLEINPDHPLLAGFGDSADSRGEDLARVLYGQAVLASGDQLDNPGDFVQCLNRLLTRG